MGECFRGEPQELPAPTAAPHCPKCKGCVLLAAMISDVRRALIVRVFECECGALLWDEKLSISPPECAATPATDAAISSTR
jgi:hypothetical protein